MKKYLKLIYQYRYYLLFLIFIIFVIIFFIFNQPKPNQSTGGSGVPDKDFLLIKGWQEKNQFGVEIGSTTSLEQERYLKNVIKKHDPETKEAIIQPNIVGQFDKNKNIDRNIFYIKTKNKKFKIIIDYFNSNLEIYHQQKLISL